MRIDEIKKKRHENKSLIQSLPTGDFSDSVGCSFRLLKRDRISRQLKQFIAKPILTMQQNAIRRYINADLPFHADLVTIGDRFAEDAAWSSFFCRVSLVDQISVLIPGCYMASEDVQFWLRRRVKELEGIDVYSLTRQWSIILRQLTAVWPGIIAFRQGSLENIPFENNHFDVIASSAVLEHVRNIEAMTKETHRVLKPGGYAIHIFGPLYYSFGADHCIAAYGLEAGYDHLLLEEKTYRERISNGAFFEEKASNANLAFWAIHDQFSFATASEYVDLFKSLFEVRYIVAIISEEALEYRRRYPGAWKRLLDSGVREIDLLIKSLAVILQKPS